MILRVFIIGTVIFLKNVIRAEETTKTPVSTNTSNLMVNKLKDGIEWIDDGISNVVESILPIDEAADLFEGRTMCKKRKKHHKHNKVLIPMLVGFVLIKAILLPVALKGLAVLSGKAVVLSLMSLILAAIVGLRRVAQGGGGGGGGGGTGPSGFSYDAYSKYRRKDHLLEDRNNLEEDDPYRYYRDHRRKK